MRGRLDGRARRTRGAAGQLAGGRGGADIHTRRAAGGRRGRRMVRGGPHNKSHTHTHTHNMYVEDNIETGTRPPTDPSLTPPRSSNATTPKMNTGTSERRRSR